MYVIVGIKLACVHRLSVMIVGKSCDELRTTECLLRHHRAYFCRTLVVPLSHPCRTLSYLVAPVTEISFVLPKQVCGSTEFIATLSTIITDNL